MKKLLLILGVFSFMTVLAVSSSTVTWSGQLLSPSEEFLSDTEILCVETGSKVTTDSEGAYEGLILRANSENTLNFKDSSGESLGTRTITTGSSNESNQILMTEF